MTERSPSGAPDRRRSGSPFEEGPVMSEDQKLLAVLRQSADAEIVDAIETLIREPPTMT